MKEGKTLRREVEDLKKRLTAGVMYKIEKVQLDADVLRIQEEKERLAEVAKQANREKFRKEFTTRKAAAEKVLSTGKEAEKLTNSELKALVLWKKRKGDKAVPTNKAAMLCRLQETMGRHDLTVDEFLVEFGVV